VARRWKLLLAVALLVGSVAAFSYTEKLKLTRSPVGVPRFERWLLPGCDCPQESVDLSFLLRKPQRVDVDIVDADGEAVRVLASGEQLPQGRVEYTWDGRDEEGAVLPDGPYRVRVRLLDDRRTIVIPVDIRVDTTPPLVEGVRVVPARVTAGGEVEIRFRTNEFGTPLLYVDGELAERGPAGAPGRRRLTWAPPGPGSYRLDVAVEDRAGNVSQPAGDASLEVTGE
jgi:hypothetical protein